MIRMCHRPLLECPIEIQHYFYDPRPQSDLSVVRFPSVDLLIKSPEKKLLSQKKISSTGSLEFFSQIATWLLANLLDFTSSLESSARRGTHHVRLVSQILLHASLDGQRPTQGSLSMKSWGLATNVGVLMPLSQNREAPGVSKALIAARCPNETSSDFEPAATSSSKRHFCC